FLAVLCMFIDNRKIKYYFAAGALVSIMLSWGKNFFLTDLLIDFFPLYNKFRAITSIQVIAELCFPVLAVLGLQAFFKASKTEQFNALKKSGITLGSIVILLFVLKATMDFSGANDAYYAQMFQQAGNGFIAALTEDRQAMYTNDLLRTLVLIVLAAGTLFAFYKEKITVNTAVIIVGVLGVFDLVTINTNYVNEDNFVAKQTVQTPFQPTAADQQILSDSGHFRVFEQQGGFSSGRSSFFHKSLGGYHAAKPKKIQDLYDYQIAQQNVEVLNMLNVKYILTKDEQGQDVPLQNPDANGNAWFVKNIEKVPNADKMMKAMKSFNSKETALVENSTMGKTEFTVDSLANIQLVNYQPNKLVYQSINSEDGFAVFSEVYYPKGWNITIDGTPVEMTEVNYTLRGLNVPAGNHTIEFRFEPEVVQKGSMISLIFSLLALATIIFAGISIFKKGILQKTNN
ncbi:MAG TPA: YfhO family protein, partial [Flavobacterium sp.]|nr:YfhO family protein [Flavobacterium sp.]